MENVNQTKPQPGIPHPEEGNLMSPITLTLLGVPFTLFSWLMARSSSSSSSPPWAAIPYPITSPSATTAHHRSFSREPGKLTKETTGNPHTALRI